MSCRVFREYNSQNIQYVANSSGVKSELFSSIENLVKDGELALQIYKTTETSKFKEVFKSEPNVKEFFKYYNRHYTNQILTSEEALEVAKFMGSTQIESLDDVLSFFEDSFLDGNNVFNINSENLIKKGIYTKQEVTNLLKSPAEVLRMRALYSKVFNSGKEGFDILPVDTHDKLFEVPDMTKSSTFGKTQLLSDIEVMDYFKKNLGRINNIEELKSSIETLDNESIKDWVENSTENFDFLASIILPLRETPVQSAIGNQVITVKQGDQFIELINSIKIGVDVKNINDKIAPLKMVDEETWYGDFKQTEARLKDLEYTLASMGVDVVGLADSYHNKSREEVVGLIDLVDDFMGLTSIKEVNKSDMLELNQAIKEFFELRDIAKVEYIQPNNTLLSNQRFIYTNKSDAEMFSTQGLLRIGENIYEEVETKESFEELLNVSTPRLLGRVDVLGRAEKVLGQKVVPTNSEQIKDLMLGYIMTLVNSENHHYDTIEELDKIKQMILFKEVFGIKTTSKLISIQDFMNHKSEVKTDKDYLANKFPSDFYKIILQEKANNTTLYTSALKHFTLDETGINMRSNLSLNDLEILKEVISTDEVLDGLLKDYSKLSKNTSLNSLVDKSRSIRPVVLQDLRDYAFYNPNSVSRFNLEHVQVNENTIVTPLTSELFFMKGKALFQNVGNNSKTNNTTFAKVEGLNLENYNSFDHTRVSDFENINDVSVENTVPTNTTMKNLDSNLKVDYTCKR